MAAERDNAERESRDKETKILNMHREMADLQERFEQVERGRLTQQRELDDLMYSKDDVGKSVRLLSLMLLSLGTVKRSDI